MVYAIQAERGGPVKVGYVAGSETAVERRRQSLQCGHPDLLVIRATVPGGRALEETLHRHLAPIRLRGEWFGCDDDDPAMCQCLFERIVAKATEARGDGAA